MSLKNKISLREKSYVNQTKINICIEKTLIVF